MTEVAERRPDTEQLRRGLRLYDATMLVMGSMIGSGIFLVSSFIARQVGAPGWLLVAWLIAATLALTGALAYAELGAMMPNAGGSFVFLSEAFSPLWGFLFGWIWFLVAMSGTIAALGVAFARFAGVFIPGIAEDAWILEPIPIVSRYAIGLSTGQLVAIGVIALLTWINTRGLDWGRIVQDIFTTSNTIALIALVVAGLVIGRNAEAVASNFEALWTVRDAQPIAVGLSAATAYGVVIALAISQMGSYFAATGYDNLAYAAGEVHDPGRNLPRALAIGVSAVIVLYLLVNVAYLTTLPFEAIQAAPADRVASESLEVVFPGVGSLLMAGLIVIATFGCNNAQILAGARVYYAMAREGLFFKQAGRLNRARVPGWSLVLQGIWSCALVLPRTFSSDGIFGNLYSDLLDYATFAILLAHAATVACVFRLRAKRPDFARPYRVTGYPFVPGLFLLLAGFVLLALVVYRPFTTWPGLGLAALGVPAYFLFRRTRIPFTK
jgi:APA family basic amino acid/polyamine antiporter